MNNSTRGVVARITRLGLEAGFTDIYYKHTMAMVICTAKYGVLDVELHGMSGDPDIFVFVRNQHHALVDAGMYTGRKWELNIAWSFR